MEVLFFGFSTAIEITPFKNIKLIFMPIQSVSIMPAPVIRATQGTCIRGEEPSQTPLLSLKNAGRLANFFSKVGALLQETAEVKLSSDKFKTAIDTLRRNRDAQAECKTEIYMMMDAFCVQKDIDLETMSKAMTVVEQVCDALSKPSDALSESAIESASNKIQQILLVADDNIDTEAWDEYLGDIRRETMRKDFEAMSASATIDLLCADLMPMRARHMIHETFSTNVRDMPLAHNGRPGTSGQNAEKIAPAPDDDFRTHDVKRGVIAKQEFIAIPKGAYQLSMATYFQKYREKAKACNVFSGMLSSRNGNQTRHFRNPEAEVALDKAWKELRAFEADTLKKIGNCRHIVMDMTECNAERRFQVLIQQMLDTMDAKPEYGVSIISNDPQKTMEMLKEMMTSIDQTGEYLSKLQRLVVP